MGPTTLSNLDLRRVSFLLVTYRGVLAWGLGFEMRWDAWDAEAEGRTLPSFLLSLWRFLVLVLADTYSF
jgi:hypothetical protein